MSERAQLMMICDFCRRPQGAHLPSELAECATFDPRNDCTACAEAPAIGLGDPFCVNCREWADAYPGREACTFSEPHEPGQVRRYIPATGRFEWVAPPAPSVDGEKT